VARVRVVRRNHGVDGTSKLEDVRVPTQQSALKYSSVVHRFSTTTLNDRQGMSYCVLAANLNWMPYLLTYLITYLLHGAESFLSS